MPDDAVIRILMQDATQSGGIGAPHSNATTNAAVSGGSSTSNIDYQNRQLLQKIATSADETRKELVKLNSRNDNTIEDRQNIRNILKGLAVLSTGGVFTGIYALAKAAEGRHIAAAAVSTASEAATQAQVEAVKTGVSLLSPENIAAAKNVALDTLVALGPEGVVSIIGGIAAFAGLNTLINKLFPDEAEALSPEMQVWTDSKDELIKHTEILERIAGGEIEVGKQLNLIHNEILGIRFPSSEATDEHGNTVGIPNKTPRNPLAAMGIPPVPTNEEDEILNNLRSEAVPNLENIPEEPVGRTKGSRPLKKEEWEELNQLGMNLGEWKFGKNRLSATQAERANVLLGQEKYAHGGRVNGPGGTDNIPAWLSEGEVVIPKDMVEDGEIDHLRGELPGFAEGGRVNRRKGGSKRRKIDSAIDIPFDLSNAATNFLKNKIGDTTPAQYVSGISNSLSAVGGKVAEFVPVLGAAIEGTGELTKTFASLMEAVDKTVEKYGEYSPAIANAQGMAELKQTMSDFTRAQEVGNELAKYIETRAEMQQKIEDVKVKVLTTMLPSILKIMEVIENIMPAAGDIAMSIRLLIAPLEMQAKVLNAIWGVAQDQNREPVEDPTTQILDKRNGFDNKWVPNL